ncbi:uncharacterized protein LDX57_005039 [Aspergillus melleus]|uniref:uncharacterized protein n=1 Tax=Aspergillus melleus TaxID=138277 RepID=UPI001E8CFE19|nr:uncharacterized protein LDX57_005039 [Aspergillus melleus]KAH8427325.1 hypothetical protein LDX57_005039 [Aspergillus melleus]
MLDIDLRNEVKRAPELVSTHTRPKNLVEAGFLVERYERLLEQEKAERSRLHPHKHRASRGGHRPHQRRRSQRNPSCHSHSEAYHAPKRRGFVQVGSQPKNRLTDAER